MRKSTVLDRLMTNFETGAASEDGAYLIHVGRQKELADLANDNELIASGQSRIRFVTGCLGAGKTHLRMMHTAQCAEQNLVVGLVDGLTFGHEEFAFQFGHRLWESFLLSLEAGKLKGLYAIVDSIAASLIPELIGDESLIFDRLRSEVTEPAYDIMKIMIRLVRARAVDDDYAASTALTWLAGHYESRVDTVLDLGISTLIQDAPWVERMHHLAFVLRAFGFAGLSVQMEYVDALLMTGCFKERVDSTYKLIRLAQDCASHRFGGLGFVVYLECETASMVDYELDFLDGKRSDQFGWDPWKDEHLGRTELPLSSLEELRTILFNVGRVCVDAPYFSQAFRDCSVEETVNSFLRISRCTREYPGPCIMEYMWSLRIRISSAS